MTQIRAEADSVILRARGISKEFPGVKALSDVSLDVRRGEVLALLGENGAGKSTLIKILSGVYTLDAGSLEMEGRPVRFDSPAEAKAAGIGIIHQELNYVATISVAENIYMGEIPRRGLIIDYRRMYEGARRIMARIGVDIDPHVPIGSLTVAQKQLIEIAKVIAGDIKILIMDEPTSALNDVETENLFRFIDQARDMGLAIIYISHKLDELFRVADRVVVLRDGRVTGELTLPGATREQLIATMVGRKLTDMYPKTPAHPSGVALEVKGLSNDQLIDITFSARKGEIFGIYGLLGSGHQDLGAALFGQALVTAGEIRVDGKPVRVSGPLDALKNGIAYVPSERKTEGLVLISSVRENMLASYYAKHSRHHMTNRRIEDEITRKWIDGLNIKTPSSETRAESLSGGNQQKVVLSKCLELEPEIMILNEPTRGIDVGAKAEIYRILDELCKKGKCVIMITSEMPELLTMSDRIMVMHEGRIGGFLDAKDATQEQVMKYAIGG